MLMTGVTGKAHAQAALRARGDTAYACEWTADEQTALEAGLARWPVDATPAAERYLRIAAGLPRKTARDVALRARWLAASGAAVRKRKAADEASSKKAQQQALRRERGQSIFAVQPKLGMGCGVGAGMAGLQGSLTGQAMAGVTGMAGPLPLGMGMAVGMSGHMAGAGVHGPGMMPGGLAVGAVGGPAPAYATPALPMASNMPQMPQLDDHGAATVCVEGC